MAFHKVKLGTLSISTSPSAASNILSARELAMARAIVFYNPAAFTGTISVQVGAKDDSGTSDMKALYSNGTAITLTAGRVERFDVSGFEAIRAVTSGTEGAQRDIDVYAILDIGG